jgi:hypothetical protein
MSTRRRILENRFNDFMLSVLPGLKGAGYNPIGFMKMVRTHGTSLAVARVLLDDPRNTHDGFQRLYSMKRLDASAEYAASLPWFEELFTPAQLYKARTRLVTHEFNLDGRLAGETPPSWIQDLGAAETTADS